MKKRTLYFSKIYSRNKWLFVLVLLFVIGQIVVTYRGVDNLPWRNWAMYAKKEQVKKVYTITEIWIDDKLFPLERYSERQQSMILRPIERYKNFAQYKDNLEQVIDHRMKHEVQRSYCATKLLPSAKDINNFPIWLSEYLSEVSNRQISKVIVKEVSYASDKNPDFQPIASQIILEHVENSGI